MNQEPLIDASAVAQIKEIGGNELFVKLVDLFNDYVAGRIAAARSAMEQGNFTGVQEAVHPIKSSAANLGARHVRELAQQIEQLARQQNAAPLPGRIADLESAFVGARAELQRMRSDAAG